MSLVTPAASGQTRGTSLAPAISALRYDVAEVRLELAVRLALLESLGSWALPITVAVDGDAVTLTGRVTHSFVPEAARQAASSVPGVGEVEVYLETPVETSPWSMPDAGADRDAPAIADALLEFRVRMRLLDALGADAIPLDVEAHGGTVRLAGGLPSEEAHEIATSQAETTPGVHEVVDSLRVDAP